MEEVVTDIFQVVLFYFSGNEICTFNIEKAIRHNLYNLTVVVQLLVQLLVQYNNLCHKCMKIHPVKDIAVS